MGAKVLVVEDDHYLLTAYTAKLSKAGFEVQSASDGEKAIEVLQTFVPDIILLDIIMPRKDGIATLTEIKANDATKNIPVVMASNLGQQEDIAKAKSLGAVDYITKSDLSMEDLVNKINSIVGAK